MRHEIFPSKVRHQVSVFVSNLETSVATGHIVFELFLSVHSAGRAACDENIVFCVGESAVQAIVTSARKRNDLVLLLVVHGCSRALQKCVIVIDGDQKEEVRLLLEREEELQAAAIETANICNFALSCVHVNDPVVALRRRRRPRDPGCGGVFGCSRATLGSSAGHPVPKSVEDCLAAAGQVALDGGRTDDAAAHCRRPQEVEEGGFGSQPQHGIFFFAADLLAGGGGG